MKYCWSLIILMYVVMASPAQARDFFVDAVRGDDKSSGTSAAKPWRSAERFEQAALQPGDRVLLKRGQIFYGHLNIRQSGKAGQPLVFGAYGRGAKPVVTGALPGAGQEWRMIGKNVFATAKAVPAMANQLPSGINASLYVRDQDGEALVLSDGLVSATNSVVVQIGKTARDRFGLQMDLAAGQIAVKENGVYALKFLARANRPVRLPSLGIIQNAAPWQSLVANEQIADVAKEWKQVQLYFESTADSRQAKLNLSLGDLPAGTMLEIRDVQFGQASNPVNDLQLAEAGSISMGGKFGSKKSTAQALKRNLDFYYDNNERRLVVYYDKQPKALDDLRIALTRDLVTIDGQKHVSIGNWRLTQTGAHAVYASNVEGLRVHDVEFSDIGGGYQYGTTRYGNGVELWNQARNVRIDHNAFSQIYDAPITNQGFAGSQTNIEYDHNYINGSGLGFEIWLQGGRQLGPLSIHHNVIVNGGQHYAYGERPDQRVALLEFGYTDVARLATITVSQNVFARSKKQLLSLSPTLSGNMHIVIKDNLWWQDGKQAAFSWGDKTYAAGHGACREAVCLPQLARQFSSTNKVAEPGFKLLEKFSYQLPKGSQAARVLK